MFFLCTIVNIPATYGGLAEVILERALQLAPTVHIVCDTYPDGPSIKFQERTARGDMQIRYAMTGPLQKRPSDFSQALLSSSFKTALCRFLVDEWTSDNYISVLEHHCLYLATEEQCYKYTVEDEHVIRTDVPELTCTHEEADTRLVFHGRFCSEQSPNQHLVFRCNDTDIFLLLLHHAHYLPATIWMDAGLSCSNTRRTINMTRLAHDLGKDICNALLGFHAFTGSDFTAAFMRKGKVRPYQIMVKHTRFMEAFAQLGESSIMFAPYMVARNQVLMMQDFNCS